jgi:hypothetical protein
MGLWAYHSEPKDIDEWETFRHTNSYLQRQLSQNVALGGVFHSICLDLTPVLGAKRICRDSMYLLSTIRHKMFHSRGKLFHPLHDFLVL